MVRTQKTTKHNIKYTYTKKKGNPFYEGLMSVYLLFLAYRMTQNYNVFSFFFKSLYYVLIRPFGKLSQLFTRVDHLEGCYFQYHYEHQEGPYYKYNNSDLKYTTVWSILHIPVWSKTRDFDDALNDYLISENENK